MYASARSTSALALNARDGTFAKGAMTSRAGTKAKTRATRRSGMRVEAKDYPKPDNIDKTDNYRIASELSKRFATDLKLVHSPLAAPSTDEYIYSAWPSRENPFFSLFLFSSAADSNPDRRT